MVEKMAATPEGDGSLLDSCALTLGSGMGDGRIHDYNDLPVVIAGDLGGSLKTGQHWKFGDHQPLANLWMAMLQGMDVKCERFADSTGVLKDVLV